jgi:hypothetical protein
MISMSSRWRGTGCSAAAGLALMGLLALPARADEVTDWNATATATIAPMGIGSATPEERYPVYAVDLATLNVAIYDTVNAFAGRYAPFAAVPTAPLAGASQRAALHEAAYTVLRTLYPSRGSFYEGSYQARMAGLVNVGETAAAIALGQAVGRDVATQVIEWRRGTTGSDGRDVPAPWTNGDGTVPGQFVSPNPATLVNRNVPSILPFTMASAAQFRPEGPPALGSARYAEDYAEVQDLGIDEARSARTGEQDNLAKFHTEPPPLFWGRNLARFASGPDLVDNARTMAAVWVAQADASIGCFEAKYHFNAWRPRTAIPAGATDGNGGTLADPTWEPNEPTPNHPEYPAAHGCAAGAAMEVVRQVYGTKKLPFFFDSNAAGLPAQAANMGYESTDDFLRDVKDARVYGGMHFRYATDDGTSLGRQVAKWVLKYWFGPTQ